MKIFDLKFLILIGLAIILFFIYREIESQRNRIHFCEEQIKEINLNIKNIPKLDNNQNLPIPLENNTLNLTLPTNFNNTIIG